MKPTDNLCPEKNAARLKRGLIPIKACGSMGHRSRQEIRTNETDTDKDTQGIAA
jgi:hypothetical protein